MDERQIARELVLAARDLVAASRVAYRVHPSARKRPMTLVDASKVMDAVDADLRSAYVLIGDARKGISRAADFVEGSRVNLNFVQIGATSEGSTIERDTLRRVERAVVALEKSEEALEEVRKGLWDAENQMVQADKEVA